MFQSSEGRKLKTLFLKGSQRSSGEELKVLLAIIICLSCVGCYLIEQSNLSQQRTEQSITKIGLVIVTMAIVSVLIQLRFSALYLGIVMRLGVMANHKTMCLEPIKRTVLVLVLHLLYGYN